MPKNTKIISLSVGPEHAALLQRKAAERGIYKSVLARQLVEDFIELNPVTERKLKKLAEQQGVTIAQLVEQLVEKFPVSDSQHKAVILKIPLPVLESRDVLAKWLQGRCDALLKYFFSS